MNIFEITTELQQLIDVIEENGGEITPELEEQLALTQENFEYKLQSYVNVVRELTYNVECIKKEKERLNELQKRKEKTIEKLNDVIKNCVVKFGDTTKYGGKYMDLPNGKVSIRNSETVEIDEELTNRFVNRIAQYLRWYKFNNLEGIEEINRKNISEYCNAENDKQVVELTEFDVDNINAVINTNINVSRLLDSEKGISFLKLLLDLDPSIELKSKVNKNEIKIAYKEEGLLPTYAVINKKQTVNIK